MKRGRASNRLLDFYFGIPLLNLFAYFRRRGRYPEQPEKIGLLFNPALGDTLLASAAVLDIRALFPSAKLILFPGHSNLGAAKLLPEIDSIEVLPITRPDKAIPILRGARLDLLLDFTAWQRITAFYTLMSGARYKVGFERQGQYRHRGYDMAVAHRGDCHEIENLRRLTAALGASSHSPPRLVIPDGPLPDVVTRAERFIVFHCWATGTFSYLREWPDDRWVSLAQQLLAPGRVFLLTGSPNDEQGCQLLREKLVAKGIPAEVLIGKHGIAGVAQVLRRAEMLVSVNTGIMHLGAILGVPTVALNGPNSQYRWGPVGPFIANVPTIDGSGGFLDLGFEFQGRNVMDKISIEDAVLAVKQLELAAREFKFAVRR